MYVVFAAFCARPVPSEADGISAGGMNASHCSIIDVTQHSMARKTLEKMNTWPIYDRRDSQRRPAD